MQRSRQAAPNLAQRGALCHRVGKGGGGYIGFEGKGAHDDLVIACLGCVAGEAAGDLGPDCVWMD